MLRFVGLLTNGAGPWGLLIESKTLSTQETSELFGSQMSCLRPIFLSTTGHVSHDQSLLYAPTCYCARLTSDGLWLTVLKKSRSRVCLSITKAPWTQSLLSIYNPQDSSQDRALCHCLCGPALTMSPIDSAAWTVPRRFFTLSFAFHVGPSPLLGAKFSFPADAMVAVIPPTMG